MKSKHLLNITVPAEHTSRGREATLWCEIERSADSIILQTDGNGKGTYPLLLASDVEAADVKAEAGVPFTECPPEVQAIALRLDDPRIKWGHIYAEEREDVEAWLAGELDDPNSGSTVRIENKRKAAAEERKRENAFLKEKGYRWEKRNVYLFGPGEVADGWFLLNPNGEVVRGAKAAVSGEEVVETGPPLKNILTELGYYGQEAIDALVEAKAAQTEHKRMRETVAAYFADDANRTGETFEDAESEFSTRPVYLESHYPRRRFRIETDALWLESHNTSDGDDWRFNNCDYGIARQYKYDAEIADYIRKLAK